MRFPLAIPLATLLATVAACDLSPDADPVDDQDAESEDPVAGVRPNIVYIVVDDLDRRMMAHMPRTRALIADKGIRFTNAFVTYSLCTPSRVSVLTGKYPHNHRVLGNDVPDGGHTAFHDRGAEASTIAVWLKQSGYKTALIGKYVNGYPAASVGPNYKPPGWTDWFALVRGVYDFFDYQMVENGTRVSYGHEARDYSTDVIARKAAGLIQKYEADDARPFFLYIAPTAPHGPAISAPRHAGMFSGTPLPPDPAFDEPDVSDKPPWVRDNPRLTAAQKDGIRATYRRRLRSVQAVDDLVEKVVAKLADAGELGRTVIIFTSDNGYKAGQHRIPGGKTSAYEEDIRLPLYVRGPNIPVGQTRQHLVLNIDLAPTMAALGQVNHPGTDGRSLLPVLKATPVALANWRNDFLVINRPSGSEPGAPRFNAVRRTKLKYIETGASAVELYDLDADPNELASKHASASATLKSNLSHRIDQLLGCAGASCF